jgi:phosphoenolpyruvate carboxylase
MLANTDRSQNGEAVFEIIEQVRQTSIRFHRDEDQGARRELEVRLNGLLPRQTMAVIRAFSYLSHLANFAEDQHHIRRRRAHAFDRSAPREGSMAYALARAQEAGISQAALRFFFASGVICPVLTEHRPTGGQHVRRTHHPECLGRGALEDRRCNRPL